MKYISTRGQSQPVDFVTASLAGLAPDGGLYVPETWPTIERAQANEPYAEVATRVLSAFAGDALDADVIAKLCKSAYASFSHRNVAPLVQVGPNRFVLELHHGPTLAFKDVAMQIIAKLFDHVLSERGERMSVVCATSGDTGGAAAAAFAGARNVDLFILHPHERVSPVQRLFMTTTGATNVHNFALKGDFDDCQAIVKAMFADREFANRVQLSGVNSINWTRIAAQSVYYATCQAAFGADRPIRFVVPSGNMGDALAGYVAARSGMLAGFELVCAVNENRTLEDLFAKKVMKRAPAVATPSPAMDISVPSNFERILFEATGRDGGLVSTTYERYNQAGEVSLPETAAGRLGCMGLSVNSVTNHQTMTELQDYLGETGQLICPHTAVGAFQAKRLPQVNYPTVILSTAHAAKFPETVKEGTGRDVPLPERCAALLDRVEDFDVISADLRSIKEKIIDAVSR